MTRQETARFFIVGCQRTGTTLMRLALECHPQIDCLDETKAYAYFAGDEPYNAANSTCLGFKIPRWTECLGETGGELPSQPFYRGEPVVFLLRDVRDTVASMMALRQGATSWMEAWGRPILEKKISEDRQFREKNFREIALMRAADSSSAVVGALYWLYKTSSLYRYQQRGWPILGVRYEDLVTQPEHELRRIIRTLGLSWDPAPLNHPGFPHTEIYPGGRTVGETDPSRSIDAQSVGRWRQMFSDQEEADILTIADSLNEQIQKDFGSTGEAVAA